MKKILILLTMLVSLSIVAQEKGVKNKIVDTACGQCQFSSKLKNGCDLAVRIKGKVYFVEGTKIDDHGDAHAEDGFCNAIRHAKVTGVIKDGKFIASTYVLIPRKNKKA